MFDYLQAHASEIFVAVTSIIAAASAIANLTPTDTDNKIIGALGKLINFLALNWTSKK